MASPLGRFAALDFLVMGMEGKRILWANAPDLAGLRSRLPEVGFDGLLERADSQRAALEPFRAQTGRDALARTSSWLNLRCVNR